MKTNGCAYLEDCFRGPESYGEILDYIVSGLKLHVSEFDTIAFRGVSGALFAPAVAHALEKYMICVRKPDEKRHSVAAIEGVSDACRYVILDDVISSGSTCYKIQEAIFENNPRAVCVGLFLYVNGRGWVPYPQDVKSLWEKKNWSRFQWFLRPDAVVAPETSMPLMKRESPPDCALTRLEQAFKPSADAAISPYSVVSVPIQVFTGPLSMK